MINNQNRAYFIRTFLNVIKLTNESKYIICNTLISIPGHICAYDITFLLARVCGLFKIKCICVKLKCSFM